MDAATGLAYMQQRYYDPEIGRFLSVDPVTADGNTGANFNRYWYAENNPYSNLDRNGAICTYFVSDAEVCARSVRYADLDGDTRISSRTRFFGAASVVTNVLGSQRAGGFMASLGRRLEKANLERANRIRSGQLYGSGDIAANDADFVHFEQGVVQGALDSLRASSQSEFDSLIEDTNALLNGPRSRIVNATDPSFAKALAITKKELGGPIDFAKQEHREALGRAVAGVVRSTQNFCTGSHIRKC